MAKRERKKDEWAEMERGEKKEEEREEKVKERDRE